MESGWLDSLREVLGDLVKPVPWNEYRRSQFSDRWESAKQAGEDAHPVDAQAGVHRRKSLDTTMRYRRRRRMFMTGSI